MEESPADQLLLLTVAHKRDGIHYMAAGKKDRERKKLNKKDMEIGRHGEKKKGKGKRK